MTSAPAETSGIPPAVRVLLGTDCVLITPGTAADLDRLALGGMPGRVALAGARPLSRRRLRRAADRLGLEVEAEYAVLPTWERAAVVVEDDGATLSWTFANLVTVPPGVARGARLVDLAVRACRVARLSRLSARMAPGRLLVGRRP